MTYIFIRTFSHFTTMSSEKFSHTYVPSFRRRVTWVLTFIAKQVGPSRRGRREFDVVASGRILGTLIIGHFSIGTLSNRDERYEVEFTKTKIEATGKQNKSCSW